MFFLSSLSLSGRSVTTTSPPKRAAIQLRKKIRKVHHRLSKNNQKNNCSPLLDNLELVGLNFLKNSYRKGKEHKLRR